MSKILDQSIQFIGCLFVLTTTSSAQIEAVRCDSDHCSSVFLKDHNGEHDEENWRWNPSTGRAEISAARHFRGVDWILNGRLRPGIFRLF